MNNRTEGKPPYKGKTGTGAGKAPGARKPAAAGGRTGGPRTGGAPAREGGFKPRTEGGYKPRREAGEGEAHPRSSDGRFKPRTEGGFKPRTEGGFKPRTEGGYKPRSESGAKPRTEGGYKPRTEGEFKPRTEGGFKPRTEGGFKPRTEGGYKPRTEGGFKPRTEGGFKPRNEGGYKPRTEGEFKPRTEGGFKPRTEGGFKPRTEGGFKPRTEGGYKPRTEGGYKPRTEGDFKPRTEGGYKPRTEGEFKPRTEGGYKPRTEGGYKPRPEGGYKPRTEGGYKPRTEGESKPRPEGGYKPRTEGGFKPRTEGGYKPRTEGGYKPHAEGPKRPSVRGEVNAREDFKEMDRDFSGNVRGPRFHGPETPVRIGDGEILSIQAEREESDDRVEGRNPVLEAFKSGHEMNKVYLEKDTEDPTLLKIAAMARDNGVPVLFVDRRKLDLMSSTRSHQGVIVEVAAHEYVEVEDIVAKAKEKGEDPFIIILDGVTDPNNLGSVLRSAECAGCHGVIIPKRRAVAVNATVAKVSAGAHEHVAVARVSNLVSTIKTLKGLGVWVAAADAEAEKSYSETDLKGPIALVVGGEGEGISRIVTKECDLIVKIPMKGVISSLNAGVAAALLMFEVARQRG